MSPSRVTGNLHPYVRPLTVSDLGSCEALENAAFKNEEERATREKVLPNLPFFILLIMSCVVFVKLYSEDLTWLVPNLMGDRMNND
jgi:hypothetical protein